MPLQYDKFQESPRIIRFVGKFDHVCLVNKLAKVGGYPVSIEQQFYETSLMDSVSSIKNGISNNSD